MRLVFLFANICATKNRWLNKEDLVQEGVFGLIRAIEKYDPERGAFSTYASYWIRQNLQNYYRRQSKQTQKQILDWDKIPDKSEDSDYAYDDLKILQETLSELPERSIDVLHLRHLGYSLQKIASKYGLSKERIRQIEIKALHKLKKVYHKNENRCIWPSQKSW